MTLAAASRPFADSSQKNTSDEGKLRSTASEFVEAMEKLSDQSARIREVPSLTLIRIELNPYSRAAQRMKKVPVSYTHLTLPTKRIV